MNQKVYKTEKGTELPLLNLRGRDYLEVKYRLVWFREDRPDWSIETNFVSANHESACARAVIRNEEGRIIATSHKMENIKNFHDFLEKAETGAIGRALALIGYGTQFCADELDEGQRIVDAPVQQYPKVRTPEKLAAHPKTGVHAESPRKSGIPKATLAISSLSSSSPSSSSPSSSSRAASSSTSSPDASSPDASSSTSSAGASSSTSSAGASSSTSSPATSSLAAPKSKIQRLPTQEQNAPGEHLITFGRKYRGKKLKEVPREQIEGYLAWLGKDAEKKKTPLSPEVRILKTAVELYFDPSSHSEKNGKNQDQGTPHQESPEKGAKKEERSA
jgi:hypothetical protein